MTNFASMKTPKDIEKYRDYYSEPQFWDKVKSVAKKAGVKAIYAALVLYYALQNPAISMKDKGMILGALGYFILPVDLIPDFLPALGFTDDLAALVIVFNKVSKAITPEVRAQAKAKLHTWFGNPNQEKPYDFVDEQ